MTKKVLVYKIPSDTRNKTQIKALINQLDLIINELLTSALKSAMNGVHSEYELDTGQTKNKVVYTSSSSIMKAVEDFERLRQYYQNKLLGTTGMVRLMDEKNFRRNC